MKVLYIHQYFATRNGSSGTRSYEFGRLLRERGHEVTILCGWDPGSGFDRPTGKLVDQVHLDGLNVLRLRVAYDAKMGYVGRLFAFLKFMFLASWVAVRQSDVDIVFATSTPLTIAVPAMVFSWVRRRPFVFEVRDLWPEVPIGLGILRNPILIAMARILERLAYRSAKHIVACSPGMKEGILRSGIEPNKVTVIPNASDNDLFDVPATEGLSFRARHPHLPDRLVVYAGAFGRVNGLSYLVRLAKAVSRIDGNIGFLLIGEGNEEDSLKNLADELGVLGKNLWFLDPIPRNRMPEVLSAATVLTSTVTPDPVLWNNSANKFFDALAAGRPIVINHGGWLADLIEDAELGVVLPPEASDAAAQILVELLHSESRLERAGSAAQSLARERFDRRVLVDQLEQVLMTAGSDETVVESKSPAETMYLGR